MEDDPTRVRVLSATLMPDCSIELEVSLPGWDEPQHTVVEQSADFLTRAGDKPRPIDLEGLDSTDLLAQVHIAKRLGRIERELARRPAYAQPSRKAATPSVSKYEPVAC